MYLPGIGELTEFDNCWRLEYERCRHIQYLARVGLEEIRSAEAYIRGGFAHCLICQPNARPTAAAD